jgi:DNA topoisomerase-1
MGRNLVVVESPAKAKTLKKFLGKEYEVLASYGHVRDLIPKEGAVDPDNDFAAKYQVIERNERHVDAIARALKKSDSLLLATDPDREGEAIAWHLVELMKERNILEDKTVHRVVFHEITRRAIEEAVSHPQELSNDLVNAQQARRVLDYLVGFNLSPLLWKKVRRGLSAGRVQSPALRLIVEREDEIAAFVAREYWTIDAELEKDNRRFPARLTVYARARSSNSSASRTRRRRAAESAIAAPPRSKLLVETVTRKERRRSPPPPFTTSTLPAGRRAQARLRHAEDDAHGATALRGCEHRRRRGRPHQLHAHRLDQSRRRSTDRDSRLRRRALRRDAGSRAAALLQDEGEECTGSARGDPPDFRGTHAGSLARAPRRRSAEALRADLEAHRRLPDGERALRHGRGRLWRRRASLQANGSVLVDPGFLAVPGRTRGQRTAESGDEGPILPPLAEGKWCRCSILPEQHFTEPPPRYSERAS